MQQPTCTNVRIRSTADAHKIFGSVQQGLLHMVTRRLDAEERLALSSGCVYAWEERGPHSEITGLGIERFTEGRRWSPSRVRDEFLFYYEKYSPPADVNSTGNSVERHPPRDWDPLVKQTYSVWVETDKGRRKWHLTAYFTQATIDHLGTIDDIIRVRDVVVPDGMFKSTRVGKRSKTDEHTRSDASRVASSGNRTYAPFPSPYPQQGRPATPSTNPVLMHEPYQRRDQAEYYHQEESSAPYSQRSSSPVTPAPASGQYYAAVPSYSGHSRRSNPYVDQPPGGSPYSPQYPSPSTEKRSSSPVTPTPASGQYYADVPSYSGHSRRSNPYVDQPPGGSPYSPQHPSPSTEMPGTAATNPQGYPNNPRILSPPWVDHNSYYYPRPIHSGGPTSSHSAPYHHSHSSSISPRSNHPGSHTPSYSLQSALTPPQPTSDYRGMALAPLQIPLQRHSGVRQCQTPPDSAVVTEDQPEEIDQVGLAPLNELKRQTRYRREPLDEKTLRLLIAGQSTP